MLCMKLRHVRKISNLLIDFNMFKLALVRKIIGQKIHKFRAASVGNAVAGNFNPRTSRLMHVR